MDEYQELAEVVDTIAQLSVTDISITSFIFQLWAQLEPDPLRKEALAHLSTMIDLQIAHALETGLLDEDWISDAARSAMKAIEERITWAVNAAGGDFGLPPLGDGDSDDQHSAAVDEFDVDLWERRLGWTEEAGPA